jgi:hypothetical protein
VSTVKLVANVTCEFNFLVLQLLEAIRDEAVLDINDACNPAEVGLINSNYGLAYIGIVKDLAGSAINAQSLQFIGTQADVLTISSRGVVTRDMTTPLTMVIPGDYSFILVNNCVDTDLRLLVSGLVRVNAS